MLFPLELSFIPVLFFYDPFLLQLSLRCIPLLSEWQRGKGHTRGMPKKLSHKEP